MNIRKYSTALLLTAAIIFASPLLADKIGIAFEGDEALQNSITETLKADGHEIIDIAANAKGVKLDSVAAASIGKATGAEIIVSGKKVGGTIILKVLSTKNDTVAGWGGTADSVPEQVKKIIADNKEKLSK